MTLRYCKISVVKKQQQQQQKKQTKQNKTKQKKKHPRVSPDDQPKEPCPKSLGTVNIFS